MAIDVETRTPKLSNVMGGLSGPAIRPIAVRMVWECHQAVKLPIIGMGGIASIEDALEFIIAGASAVQVGTANFVDPFIWGKLIAGLDDVPDAAPDRARRRSGGHACASNRRAIDEPHSRRARRGVRRRSPRAGRFAPRIGRRLQDRQPAVHGGRAGRRAHARVAGRSRLPGPEVPRHSQHRRGRGPVGLPVGRVDAERARERRPADDGSGRARRRRIRGGGGRPARS